MKQLLRVSFTAVLFICVTVFFFSCEKEQEPVVPTVSTTGISAITLTTASTGGDVTADGGAAVTARGVCWGTDQNPTTADSKTSNGTGTGSFTSNLTGLTPGTLYYVRAYATNVVGTAYGNQQSFTTNPVLLATITTTEVTSVTGSTAISGGNISDDGGGEITARGLCWSTSTEPSLSDEHTSDGTGTGDFSSSLTGLTSETIYYVRAYATNSAGTAYGQEESFETDWGQSGTFTDARDNIEYKWVRIGDQIWMAENLAYLPSVSPSAGGFEADPYYYVYDYQGSSVSEAKAADNYTTYGVLYNWPAAMAGSASSTANPSGVQGACPTGWHLPGDAEWTELTDYLGGSNVAGGKLKETGTTHWAGDIEATNESGFTALPGGARYDVDDGIFIYIFIYGYWWSATEYYTNNAWSRYISYQYGYVYRYSGGKEAGFSVRCVRD